MATGTSCGPVASAILPPLERRGCSTRFAGSRPSETRAEKQPDSRRILDQEGARPARDFGRIAAQLGPSQIVEVPARFPPRVAARVRVLRRLEEIPRGCLVALQLERDPLSEQRAGVA